MMVGFTNSDAKWSKVSSFESSIAGAVSGFLTRGILQPLDVLKIRFQSIRTIHKQEGLPSLWKGHISAQILTVTYGMGQFGSYTFFLKLAEHWKLKDNGFAQTLAGGMAGFTGTLCSFPFDVARTRLIAQSFPKYSGFIDVIRKMYTTEGFFSLWKGLTPTLAMAVPFTAIQFRIYLYMSNNSIFDDLKDSNILGHNVPKSALCGAMAGVFAKGAVYPLDVLKKRLQIRGSEEMRHHFGKVVVYENILDCIWKITLCEGLSAWFKGLKPSLIKSAAFSGLVFTFYEISCETLISLKEKR